MSVKGLIFDFDGLIIDTEAPEYDAWQEIYRANGVTLEFSDWSKLIGTAPTAFDVVKNLENQTGKTFDDEQLRTQQRTRSHEIVKLQPILPGIVSTLDRASQTGLKLAVASSSPYEWVGMHLSRLGLLNKFNCVLTADNVKVVKPDPELYQSALDHLHLSPREAIAFEDSPNGIKAARDAGIFCVAIPNALTKMMDIGYANLTLDSLDQIPFDTLIRHVNQYWSRN